MLLQGRRCLRHEHEAQNLIHLCIYDYRKDCCTYVQDTCAYMWVS